MSYDPEIPQAISLIKTGKKTEAMTLLGSILQADPDCEPAWLWMSACVDTVEEKRYCLKQAQRINPTNDLIKEALARLEPVAVPTLEQIAPTQPSSIVNAGPTTPDAASPSPVISSYRTDSGPVEASSPLSHTIVILLLAILGTIGVFTTFMMLASFTMMPASSQGLAFFMAMTGILLCVLNFYTIGEARKRKKRTTNFLYVLCIIGTIFGIWNSNEGLTFLQILIPLYLVLGLLGLFTKNYYSKE